MSTDVPDSGSDGGVLSDEEVDTLADRVLAKLRADEQINVPRRDLLKGVGALGLGLAAGGGAVASEKINADDLVSTANAQSAASGQIGTASSRVDLFASTVDAEEASTGTLAFDYSNTFPQSPRQPERSGPPLYRLHSKASNPVLTASDVTDQTGTAFVADPFLAYEADQWHMMFEADRTSNPAEIAHATSDDGLTWTYDQIVISESIHLSHPYTFKYNGTWYCTPSNRNGTFRVYEASSLSGPWSLAEASFSASSGAFNPAVFEFGGKWWLLANDPPAGGLRVYYANSPVGGSWTEHPSSPVFGSYSKTSCAGRPLVTENYIDLPMQDTAGNGDTQVRNNRITTLTTSSFNAVETAGPILMPSSDDGQFNFSSTWRSDAMHHIDHIFPGPGLPSIAVVDGKDATGEWAIGIATPTGRAYTEARATLPANQDVSTGTETTLDLSDRHYDLGYNLDTAQDGYVAPSAGYYEVSAHALLLDSLSGTLPAHISLDIYNETKAARMNRTGMTVHTINEGLVCQTRFWLDEGDVVTAHLTHDAGSAVRFSRRDTYLEVRKVAE